MRAAVFELRNAALGIVGRLPLVVADLLVFPLLVVPANLLVGGFLVRLNRAVFPHQPGDILLPVLTAVAPHDALHGGVGFQRRAVDGHDLAGQQLLAGGNPQHELEDFLEYLLRKPIAGVGQGGVVGRRFVQRHAQEVPQAQAVGASPGDAALAVDVLEVTDQEHTKVDARRDRRLAALLLRGVILLATPLDPIVELGFGQKLVELSIERMARRLGQTLHRNEESLLPLPPLAHRHDTHLRVASCCTRRYHITRVKRTATARVAKENTSTDC